MSDVAYFRVKIAIALACEEAELPQLPKFSTLEDRSQHVKVLWQFIERMCQEKGLRPERVETAFRIYKGILGVNGTPKGEC